MSFESRAQQNTVLWDDSGNAVGVIIDGSIYRLQSQSTVVGKEAGAGANVEVTTIEDPDTETHKRLQVEADIKPGASIVIGAPALQDVISGFFEEPGGSEDMIVNGSGTPVEFTYDADPTDSVFINEIRIVFVANQMDFDGTTFGKGSGALSNGILFEAVVNGGDALTLINVTVNEDWMRFATVAGLNVHTEFGATNDVVVTSFQFGGRTQLVGGTSDEIKVTIRDNLAIGSRDIKYLTCTFYGVKEA